MNESEREQPPPAPVPSDEPPPSVDSPCAIATAPDWTPRVYSRGRVHAAVNLAISNFTAIEVDGGYVLIDTGPDVASARKAQSEFRRRVENDRLQAIIYTHGHWDHVRGTAVFHRPGIPIWAHENFAEHMRQENRLPNAYFRRGAKQFGYGLPHDRAPHEGIGPALRLPRGKVPSLIMPTHTFRERAETVIGGTRFVLVAAPGETIDQLFVWLPEERVLHAGDNVYKGFPNLYAIRGVPPRPVEQWIASLDAIRRLEPAPEYLVLGHTAPVEGADQIHQLLTDYRDAIAFVHDSVIHLAEAGKTPDDMVEEIVLPERLRRHPYLQEVYGTLKAGIRGVYAGYFGWFDGRGVNLDPLRPRELAARLAPALGGSTGITEMAQRAVAEHDPRWAIWLCEVGLSLQNERALHRVKQQALEQLAGQVQNPLMRNWCLRESADLQQWLGGVKRPQVSHAAIAQLPIEHMMYAMPARLNRRAARLRVSFGFDFIDTEKQFTLIVREGVGEVIDKLVGPPDLVLRMMEHDFRALAVDEPWRLLQKNSWLRFRLVVPETSLLSPWKAWRRLRLLATILDRP
ncbi:MAG: alkyl/aryl-sulfatase [Planctomycetes bacterium]|nr:alkyl/aryl-sulfatase [Planctomycetota bacterium]